MLMRALPTIVVSLGLLLDAGTHAMAQTGQRCDAPMNPALMTKITETNDERAKQAFKYQACSMTFTEHRNTYGVQAEAQWKLFSGSGSYTQENYDRFRSENCSGMSADLAQSAYRFYAHSSLPPEAYTAWMRCIELQSDIGLTCWAKRESASAASIGIHVVWKNPAGQLPKVTASVVINAKVLGKRELFPTNSELLLNDNLRFAIIENPRLPIEAHLNSRLGLGAFPCSVFVPPYVQAPPPCRIEPRVIAMPPGGTNEASAISATLNFSQTTGQVNAQKAEFYRVKAPCGGRVEVKLYATDADLSVTMKSIGGPSILESEGIAPKGSFILRYVPVERGKEYVIGVSGKTTSRFQLDASMLPSQ